MYVAPTSSRWLYSPAAAFQSPAQVIRVGGPVVANKPAGLAVRETEVESVTRLQAQAVQDHALDVVVVEPHGQLRVSWVSGV